MNSLVHTMKLRYIIFLSTVLFFSVNIAFRVLRDRNRGFLGMEVLFHSWFWLVALRHILFSWRFLDVEDTTSHFPWRFCKRIITCSCVLNLWQARCWSSVWMWFFLFFFLLNLWDTKTPGFCSKPAEWSWLRIIRWMQSIFSVNSLVFDERSDNWW